MRLPLRFRVSAVMVMVVPFMTAVCSGQTHENAIYDSLMTQGVKLGDGTMVQVPSPSLSDDSNDAKEQSVVLEEVAGRVSLREFTRNARTARFNLSLESVKDKAGKRTGQTVDLWFVAYGTLKGIEENALMEELGRVNREQAGEEGGDLNRSLTNEELMKRQIQKPLNQDQTIESYDYFAAPLLEKVQLSGVTHSLLTRSGKSTISAIRFDERFVGDDELPSQWQPRDRNKLGKMVLGTASPYTGFGGYVKATELLEPSGALLIEMHVVFDEPEGWFGGRNLLRAKIPLAIKENVQTFRKKLQDISK